MIEKDQNTSNPDISKTIARELGPTDLLRHESARWWRNLNRGMAILGVLIIAVIVGFPLVEFDADTRTDLVLRLLWQLLVLNKAGQNEINTLAKNYRTLSYVITFYEFLTTPRIPTI